MKLLLFRGQISQALWEKSDLIGLEKKLNNSFSNEVLLNITSSYPQSVLQVLQGKAEWKERQSKWERVHCFSHGGTAGPGVPQEAGEEGRGTWLSHHSSNATCFPQLLSLLLA